MRAISKSVLRKYPRPLQGGVQVLSGGGMGGGTLADQYQRAMDAANAANEARYQQILGGYDDLRSRVMGDMKNVGTQESKDIDREYRNMGSDTYQRLVNRGFANSTIPATMQMGVTREKMASQARLESQLAQQRANYDTSISQGKMGVMERRTDQAPDYNQMLQLSQQLGQSGYGSGGPRMLGAPIGIPPQAYQQAIAQQMAWHLGGNGMGKMPYRPIRANQRAQEIRRMRAAAKQMQQPAQPIPQVNSYNGPYANFSQNYVTPPPAATNYQQFTSGPYANGYAYPAMNQSTSEGGKGMFPVGGYGGLKNGPYRTGYGYPGGATWNPASAWLAQYGN